MSKFKVGDRAEIIELASVQDDEEYEKYKECVGEKGTIIKIGNFGGNSNRIKFDNTNLEDSWWNDDELELIKGENNLNKPKEINIDGIDYVLTPRNEYYARTVDTEVEKFNPYKSVKHNEQYYYTQNDGKIGIGRDTEHITDNLRYDFGNYFNDKEFAEKKSKEWKLRNLLERFSYENGGDKIDWNSTGQRKWYIYTNKIGNFFVDIGYVFSDRDIGSIYFISEEVAKLAVDKYRDLINEVYGL